MGPPQCAIAHGEAPFSATARAEYAEYLGLAKVLVATAQRALAKLLRDGVIIAAAGRAQYKFESRAFEAWIKERFSTGT